MSHRAVVVFARAGSHFLAPVRRAVLVSAALALLPCVASAQVAFDDRFTVDIDSSGNQLDVLANDLLGRGSALIWSVTPPSQGGRAGVGPERQSVIYTPAAGFEGTETFRYIVIFSGFRVSSAEVQVDVTGGNAAPVAREDSYSTVEDTLLEVSAQNGVLANDLDVDGDALQAALVSGPANGTLDLETSGAFTYRPRPGFLGEDSFFYTANDGRVASQPAEVRITVLQGTQPPVISAIPDQTGSVGVAFELDLAAFVSDADTPAESLSFAASALPPGLSLSPAGQLSGFPTLEAAGTTEVRFTVTDGEYTVEGQFALTIMDQRVTDLALSLSVAPNPLPIDGTATWTITVSNDSNYNVDTVTVEGQLMGEVPFTFDTPIHPACSLESSSGSAAITCTLGPLAEDESTTLELGGTSNQPGDVYGIASATAGGPPEADPTDNVAAASLSVAEEISVDPAQSLSGFEALAVAGGDLDGDTHDDLAVATANGDSVLVFLNTVDPADERKRRLGETPLRLGAAVRDEDIALGDLDADGDLDIVASGSADAFPRVFLNDGAAGFEAVTLDDSVSNPTGVAIGDLDADGFADIALSGSARNVAYLGAGVPGEFSAPTTVGGAPSSDVAAAGLFGDGRDELVFAKPDGNARIYSLAGSSFTLASTLPSGTATSVTAGDFDRDGAVDLMFGRAAVDGASQWPSNPLFLNDPSAAQQFTMADGLGAAPTSFLMAADTDASGGSDVVVLNETGAHQILLNSGTGEDLLVLAARQLSVPGAKGAALGRFGIDARSDLAIGGAQGVKVFWSNADGAFGVGDVTAPTINLLGASTIEVFANEPFNDPGATAMDTDDGDLSDQIVVTNPVNTNVIGDYVVTYEVWDSSGNAAETRSRTVEVTPREAAGGGGGGAFGPVSLLGFLLVYLLGGSAVTYWPGRGRSLRS